jgi:hypothetical protein
MADYLVNMHEYDTCDLREFSIYMADTILVSQNAPNLTKHSANGAIRTPLKLLDDIYHGMEQQIETENAVREVKGEEIEAAAAVLKVKLYEIKMARMSD